jgi:multiple sugar transport system substrate-binding protein
MEKQFSSSELTTFMLVEYRSTWNAISHTAATLVKLSGHGHQGTPVIMRQVKEGERKVSAMLLLRLPTFALAFLAISLGGARAQSITWPSFQWSESNNAPVMLELKRRFEEENPGVTVSNIPVPPAVFWDKQFTDTMSGNPPDIATLYDPEVRTYIEAGVLEPLDQPLRAAGIPRDGFVPTAALGTKGGVTYAVPFQINARALFYNEKLLQDAGLSPPGNYEEFLKAVRALRQPRKQQFGFATLSRPGSAADEYIEIMPIVAGFGGAFIRNGKPSANAPETLEALRFLKLVYSEQLIPRGMDRSAYRSLFAQGRIGMYATGSFMAAVVSAANPETYANLRAIPLPLPTGETTSITVFLGVPKSARNKEAAGRLLARMMKDDMQAAIVTMGKTYPGRVGFVPPGFVTENPWFAAFEKATLSARSYAPQGAEQYGAEIVKIVSEHVEAMLFGNEAPEQTVDRMQVALATFLASKAK